MRRLSWQSILSLIAMTGSVALSSVTVFSVCGETVVSEVAPGVFVRKAQLEPTFDGCNQGWVVFNEFVLVIEANLPSQAERVIRLIQRETDKPIRYVLDTHHHFSKRFRGSVHSRK
jgi:hypothetical protein